MMCKERATAASHVDRWKMWLGPKEYARDGEGECGQDGYTHVRRAHPWREVVLGEREVYK